MPVVQTFPSVTSPPTNALGLAQYLAQRVPGFDPSEYLREIASAYIHVWEEVSKLKNHYFTAIRNVTVATAGKTFDLLYNDGGGLDAALSSRLYQVTRIRVQPPAGGLFQTSQGMHFNEPDFLAIEANESATPTFTGPYYWTLLGRGTLRFGLPLAVGTVIEIVYSFWPIQPTYLSAGTVSSAGAAVTGIGTSFTQLVQPDFASALPAVSTPLVDSELIQAEFVANTNQVYRVLTITDDTHLTTAAVVAPALGAGSAYTLATLPEIPREHIRVIAALALRNMYSIAGDDARVQEWTAIATNNLTMMTDSLIERQSNNPPRKQRFPYGVARRNRAFLR